MTKFDLEIGYPIKINGIEEVILDSKLSSEILEQFDAMSWRRFGSIQIQLKDSFTRFTVTNKITQQSIQFNLIYRSEIDLIEFNLKSDIQVVVPQRELFGILTRNIKRDIDFVHLSLSQARIFLGLFLNEEIEILEDRYKESIVKPVHETQIKIDLFH